MSKDDDNVVVCSGDTDAYSFVVAVSVNGDMKTYFVGKIGQNDRKRTKMRDYVSKKLIFVAFTAVAWIVYVRGWKFDRSGFGYRG